MNDDFKTLHELMLRRCIELLQSDETPKGSTLKEIRAFLADNKITVEELHRKSMQDSVNAAAEEAAKSIPAEFIKRHQPELRIA